MQGMAISGDKGVEELGTLMYCEAETRRHDVKGIDVLRKKKVMFIF